MRAAHPYAPANCMDQAGQQLASEHVLQPPLDRSGRAVRSLLAWRRAHAHAARSVPDVYVRVGVSIYGSVT